MELVEKISKIVLLSILSLIAYFGLSVKPAYAISCDVASLYKLNYVIAQVEKREIDCDRSQVVNWFRKLITLDYTIDDKFKVTTVSSQKDCPYNPTTTQLIHLNTPKPVIAGCAVDPEFKEGKLYIMRVDIIGVYPSLYYKLPCCNRIVKEINLKVFILSGLLFLVFVIVLARLITRTFSKKPNKKRPIKSHKNKFTT